MVKPKAEEMDWFESAYRSHLFRLNFEVEIPGDPKRTRISTSDPADFLTMVYTALAELLESSGEKFEELQGKEDSYGNRMFTEPFFVHSMAEIYDTTGKEITSVGSSSRVSYYSNVFSSILGTVEWIFRDIERVANYTGPSLSYVPSTLDTLDLYDFSRPPLQQLTEDHSEVLDLVRTAAPAENYLARSVAYRVDKDKERALQARLRESRRIAERLERKQRDSRVRALESRNARLQAKAERRSEGGLLSKLLGRR